MKTLGLICLLAAVLAAAADAQTPQIPAYEALRTVSRERGDIWLGRLVEMRGIDGEPQPRQWTLTFEDSAARGGTREFLVSTGGITGERTPLVAGSGDRPGVMAAKSLNLDSTGAFTAANREATKAKMGFHTLNYSLQNRNGTPVWRLQLYDVAGIEVGMIELSAKDGSIVFPLRAPTGMRASASPAPAPAPAAGDDDRALSERWIEGGGLVGHTSRWGERAWKTASETAVRVGDSIGAFFTGRPPGETTENSGNP